jgi:SanA protein
MKNSNKQPNTVLRIAKATIALSLFTLLALMLGSGIVTLSTKNIVSPKSTKAERDTAIVLGAGVHGLRLSQMLQSRMMVAIDLYQSNKVKNILVTGDGTDFFYNETAAMRRYATDRSVPLEAILEDPRGYSTAASMKRAAEIFDVKSAYIITQDFHLERACWLGRANGMDVQGIRAGPTNNEDVPIQWREFLAKAKDFYFFYARINPSSSREDF